MENKAYSSSVGLLIMLFSLAISSFSSVAAEAKTEGFTLDVIPIFGYHMIKLKIGTPPLEANAILETGSDLVWFNCTPCEGCSDQGIPAYDPTESTSYSNPDTCNSTTCLSLLGHIDRCIKPDTCHYTYKYEEGYSFGVLSRDEIYIPLGSGELASHQNFSFGCGLDNDMGIFNTHQAGIVGLNMAPSSLITQLGLKKFSYCLSDPASFNSSGKMVFGDDVIRNGSVSGVVTTPLKFDGHPYGDLYYHINLEGATIFGAGYKRDISNQGDFDSRVILSTGVESTYLREDFYDDLEAAVKNATGLTPVDGYQLSNNLCYNEYPENLEIVFHFTGADVKLKPLNLFKKIDDVVFCFMIFPVDEHRPHEDEDIGPVMGDDTKIALWGNMGQINFQVTYDIGNKLVSFAPTDCAKV